MLLKGYNSTWIYEPKEYHLSDEKLMIKTEPKTDFWQRTYYVCQTACLDKRHSLRRYK